MSDLQARIDRAYNKAISGTKKGTKNGTKTGSSLDDRIARATYKATGMLPELQELPQTPEEMGIATWGAKKGGVDAREADIDAGYTDLTARGQNISAWDAYLKVAEENLSAATRRYSLTGDAADLKVAEDAQNLYNAGVEQRNGAMDYYKQLAARYDAEAERQNRPYQQLSGIGEFTDEGYRLTADYGEIASRMAAASRAAERTGDETRRQQYLDEVELYKQVLSGADITNNTQAEMANRQLDEQIAELQQEGLAEEVGYSVPGSVGPVTYKKQDEINALRQQQAMNSAAGTRASYAAAMETEWEKLPTRVQNVLIAIPEHMENVNTGRAGNTGVDAKQAELATQLTDYAYQQLKGMGYEEPEIQALLDYGTRLYNEDTMEALTEEEREKASQRGWALNLPVNVAEGVLSGMGYIDMAIQGMAGENPFTGEAAPIDTNTTLLRAAKLSEATTQGQYDRTIQNLTEKGKWDAATVEEKAQKRLNLYQLANSMGESAVAAGLAAMGVPATTLILGSSAATSATLNAIDKGYSDGRALLLGFIAGATETITEQISLGSFLELVKVKDIGGAKQIILRLLKQSGVEGLEEVSSDIVNTLADAIINGNTSELRMSMEEYKRAGYSADEASRLAMRDWGQGVWQSFLGGAASGLVFGIGGTAISHTQVSRMAKAQTDIIMTNAAEKAKYEEKYGKLTGTEAEQRAAVEKTQTAELMAEMEAAEKQAEVAKKLEVLKGRDVDVVEVDGRQYSVTAKPGGITARIMENGNTVFSATYQKRVDAVKALQAWTPAAQTAKTAGAQQNTEQTAGAQQTEAQPITQTAGAQQTAEGQTLMQNAAEMQQSTAQNAAETQQTGEVQNAQPAVQTETDAGQQTGQPAAQPAVQTETEQTGEETRTLPEPKNEYEAEVMRILAEPVSNKNAERIFRSAELWAAFEELTGISLRNMTNSEMKTAIKGQGESFAGYTGQTAQETVQTDAGTEAQTTQQTGERTIGLVENETVRKLREDKRLTARKVRQLDALAKSIGVELAIEERVYDNDGAEVNADYANGRITLSVNSKDPVNVLAVHEAVHRIKEADPAAFADMAGSVFGVLANESGTFAEDFRQKARDYGWMDEAGNYTTETGKADTLEEMVAQGMGYIAEHTDVLDKLAKKDRGFVQRVLDMVNDILEKVKGYQDYDANRSMEEAEAYEALGDHLELFKGKLEAALRGGENTGNGETRYSRAGQKSKTADSAELTRAKEMLESGTDSETIRKETGWFKGIDGEWRYEIDDSKAIYDPSGENAFAAAHPDYARYSELNAKLLYGELTKEEFAELRELDAKWYEEKTLLQYRLNNGEATLRDVMFHDALYKAYPEIAGTKVRLEDMKEGERGSYNPVTDTITINSKYRNNADDAMAILIHEVQHRIQKIEGFASGASIQYWENKIKRAATDALTKKQAFWNDRKVQEIMQLDEELFDEELEKLLERDKDIREKYDEYRKAERFYTNLTYSGHPSAVSFYENTAGEIEARDTADRLKMTEEDRKNSPPKIGDENTVFAEGYEKSQEKKYSRMSGTQTAAEELADTDRATVELYGRTINLQLAKNKHGVWGAAYSVQNDGVHKTDMRVVSGDTREEAIQNLQQAMREDLDKPVTQADLDEYAQKYAPRPEDALVMPERVFDVENRPTKQEAERLAEEKSYPMLRDENGGERKAVPYYTWVQTADRGNYGVVTAKGEDGKLVVWFVNKEKGTSMAVEYNAEDLTAVDTEYRLTEREYTDEEAPPEIDEENLIDPRDYVDLSQMMNSHDAQELAAAEKVLEAEKQALSTIELAERDLMSWQVNGRAYDETLDGQSEMAVVGNQVRLRNGEMIDAFPGMTAEETMQKLQRMRERVRSDIADQNYEENDEARREAMTRPKAAEAHTEVSKQLGVKVAGSPVDNWGAVEALRENERAVKKLDRQIEKTEKDYGETITRWAWNIASETNTEQEIPQGVNRELVMELAEMYRLRKNAQTGTEQKKRIQDIVKRQVEELKLDSEEYNPEGVKGILRPFSKLIMNNRTPERVFKAVFGEDVGSRVENYLLRPMRENIAEKNRFTNRMLDEVREFEDSKGKKRGLTKDERAYAQQMLEGTGYELRMSELQGTDKASVEEQLELFDRRLELQKNPNFDRTEGIADRLLRGEITREEALKNADEALLDEILKLKEDNAKAKSISTEAQKLLDSVMWWRQNRTNMLNDPKADFKIIERAVQKYGEMYDQFYKLINEHLVMHGEPEIGFIKGYAPHMQTEKVRSQLGKAMNLLGIQLDDTTQLPASIAGLTADYKPNMRWNPHFQHRTSTDTENIDWDIVRGYESYLGYLGDIIYHTDDIMKLRAMANYYRANYGSEDVKDRIDLAYSSKTYKQKADYMQREGMTWYEGMAEDKMNEAIDKHVEDLYKQQTAENMTRYSELTAWLDNYANLMAGKQTYVDRGLEGWGGRKLLGMSRKVQSLFAMSNVAASVSSMFNQMAQIPMITTKLGTKYVARAIADMASGRVAQEGFADRSDFLTGKAGIDKISKTNYEKFIEGLFTGAEFVDRTISTIAARGEYLRQLDKGVDEEIAMRRADDFARKIMGSRMKGERPQGFESKNFIAQMIHVFQVEAANTFDYMITDMPQEIRDIQADKGTFEASRVAAAAVVGYLIRAFLLNRATDELYGGTPAPFDLLGITADFFASGFGMRTNEFIEKWITDGLESMGEFDAEKGFKEAGGEIVSDIPFVENIAGTVGIGNQRMPTVDFAGIKKGFQKVGEGMKGEDGRYGGGDADGWQIAEGAVDVASNLLPGGKQLKKTVLGAKTMADGYYQQGKLAYLPEDTAFNWTRALLFGRNALPENEDYYRADNSPLSVKLTTAYKTLTGAGYGNQEAYDLMTQYRALDDYSGAEKAIKQRQLINSLQLDDAQKLEMWQMLKTDDKDDARWRLFKRQMDKGVSFGTMMSIYNKYAELNDTDDMKAREKAQELAQYIDGLGMTEQSADAFKEEFKFFSMVPVEATTYETLTDAGLGSGKAAELATLWANGDGKKLTQIAQIAGTKLTENEKWDAMITLVDDTKTTTNEDGKLNEYGKLTFCRDGGMSYDDYAEYRTEDILDTMIPMLDYMDEESAATAARAIKTAKGTKDDNSFSKTDKAVAVAASGIDADYAMAYLEDTLADSTYHRMEMGSEYGVTPALWAQYMGIRSQYDANGNGNYSSAEVTAAIRSMPGLDNDTRAALWSTVTGYKKNPFDVRFGANFYREYKAWETKK